MVWFHPIIPCKASRFFAPNSPRSSQPLGPNYASKKVGRSPRTFVMIQLTFFRFHKPSHTIFSCQMRFHKKWNLAHRGISDETETEIRIPLIPLGSKLSIIQSFSISFAWMNTKGLKWRRTSIKRGTLTAVADTSYFSRGIERIKSSKIARIQNPELWGTPPLSNGTKNLEI